MNNFLDHCYGSWFEPKTWFTAQTNELSIWEGVAAVVLVNALEGLRLNGLGGIFFQTLGGLLGWVILNSLLWLLLTALGRTVALLRLLTLTGFASLPWLLVAPVAVLGGGLGNFGLSLVLVWFIGLQTWAVAVATDLAWWRVLLLLPLTFLGALLALNWTFNGVMTAMGF